jgi:hypothetical protein
VARKGRFFTFLGTCGLLIGLFGILYSLADATSQLASHDDWIAAFHRPLDSLDETKLPPGVHKDDLIKVADQQAETLWARRGTALPLAAINLILSLLLFTGCMRALRSDPWGLSAWRMASVVSLPYLALDGLFQIVQAHEVADVLAAAPAAIAPTPLEWLAQRRLQTFGRVGVELLYCVVCLLYLRGRRLSGGEDTSPSA